MRLVYVLYGLSGFIGLGYQVVWFRTFVDRFGSTNLTFVLVLINFIGGLGAGALASRRLQDRLARHAGIVDPLRAYGFIELLIAASFGLTLLSAGIPADLLGHFPYQQGVDGVYRLTLTYQLIKAAIATACVLAPCFFMGTTFPLLCRAFERDGRFPSAVYGWNTLGACAAVLACEFILLPRVGYGVAAWILLAMNVALGLLFLALGRRIAGGAKPVSGTQVSGTQVSGTQVSGTQVSGTQNSGLGVSPKPGIGTDETSASPGHTSAQPVPTPDLPSFWLTAAIVGGFFCGALEGDLFKRLWFLGCDSQAAMSFISFWAIAAIFMASWTVRAWKRITLAHIQAALVLSVVVYLVLWHFAYDISDGLRRMSIESALQNREAGGADVPAAVSVSFAVFENRLVDVLVFVGVFVFPAYFLSSLLLPWLCNRIQGSRRHLGLAYGLNTAGFCAGLLAFTWIAPRVNIFYSLKLAVIVLGILAGLLVLIRRGRAVAAWKPIAAVAALAIAAAMTPSGFDARFFHPDNLAARYPAHSMMSNGAHTTFVVDDPAGRSLFFDSHSMSGTGLDAQRYMRLMAHVPLLAQDEPSTALLICFGVGNTASAIARHAGIQRLDVVDLNDKVYRTAPAFATTNDGVERDPRVELIHDDGRNFLNLTDRRYDLVTSEPPPPMQEGVVRLYSLEYYRSVLAHLTPHGMMTQWLPVWQMPREAVDRAAATFLAVFPHAMLFVGSGEELILIGGASPIDLPAIERRFYESLPVVRDLQGLGIDCPVRLLGRFIAGESALRRRFAGFRTISDQRNDLSWLFRDPLAEPAIVPDVPGLLQELPLDRLRAGHSLHRVLSDPALLMCVVPDYPRSLLARAKFDGAGYAEFDWKAIATLNSAADKEAEAGRVDAAIELFERSLQLAPGQSQVLARMALLQEQLGRWEQSIATWRRYGDLGLADGRAEFAIGLDLYRLRRYGESADMLADSARLNPGLAAAHKLRGDALAMLGRFPEAVESYDRALVIAPDDQGARVNREKVLTTMGVPGQ